MSDNPNLLPEVKAHYGRVQNFIDGEWVDSQSERSLPVINPATNEEIAVVPLSTRAEVEAAIGVAQEAYEEWQDTPPNIRVQPLYRLKLLLEENYEEIARVVAQEHGKIIDEARGSVRRTIDNVEFACGIPSLMMGQTLHNGAAMGIDEQAIRQPMGVFACIAPFNFPAMVPFWFWPGAVACGNTYLVKPSEQAPLTQNFLFKLVEEAGFPDGVVNVVHGDVEVADTLLTDPRVQGISFVGSTRVARIVYEKAAVNGKRVQCQGAAKNFLTVMSDARIDAALPNMIASFFGNTGQRCLAGGVLVPVGDAADELVQKFTAAASRLKLGYGLDQSVQLGPVISHASRDRILAMIDKAEAQGAKLLLDGRGATVEGYPNGAWVGPTVMEVTPDMDIVWDEVFGPVASIVRVDTLDEAIELANRSRFGNASSIYTSSGKAAREYAARVNAGNIAINLGIAAPMSYFPFGGYKDSFFGDLHGQGSDGINFFTERKVVITRWL